MVRAIGKESKIVGTGLMIVKLACDSDDTKPVNGVATGSTCLEVDTGDLYIFSEDDKTWNFLKNVGSEGGGGGGNSDLKLLNLNIKSIDGNIRINTIENGALIGKTINTSGIYTPIYSYDSLGNDFVVEVLGRALRSVTFSNAVNCEGSFDSENPDAFYIYTDNPAGSSIDVDIVFGGIA